MSAKSCYMYCIFVPVAHWINMNLICNLTQLPMD